MPFLGWYRDGKPYDFNKPVASSTAVYAGWEPNQKVSFTLPTGATVVDESTFEGTAAIYVVIPDGYTTIQSNAFKGCTQLKYIRIPATVEQIGASAFDGCSGVYVIGKELSKAETMCQGSSNFTFIIGVDE